MAELGIIGQKNMAGLGYDSNYQVTRVRHDGGVNTVEVDQSASSVVAFARDGQVVSTVSLESSGDSTTFLKTVTLTGGGSGLVDVVTLHGSAIASSKA